MITGVMLAVAIYRLCGVWAVPHRNPPAIGAVYGLAGRLPGPSGLLPSPRADRLLCGGSGRAASIRPRGLRDSAGLNAPARRLDREQEERRLQRRPRIRRAVACAHPSFGRRGHRVDPGPSAPLPHRREALPRSARDRGARRRARARVRSCRQGSGSRADPARMPAELGRAPRGWLHGANRSTWKTPPPEGDGVVPSSDPDET